MGARVAQWDKAQAVAKLSQRELLAGLSEHHRSVVALMLGQPCDSSAHRLAAAIKAHGRLETLLEELSPRARDLLAEAAFDASGIALKLTGSDLEQDHDRSGFVRWREAGKAAANELEHHGLAFAFATQWGAVTYMVPAELRPPLRSAIAARYARGVQAAGARRWLDATGQDLRDGVALWMHLAQTPLPIAMNGRAYVRSEPRLLATLDALELPDPAGELRMLRPRLAIGWLRDGGFLQLSVDWSQRYPTKAQLVAAGDLAGALYGGGADIERFPWDLGHGVENSVMCAQALAGALAGLSVDLASFGRALQKLMAAVDHAPHDATTTEVALSGLLPAWLRGEAQLGMRGRDVVAVRFGSPEPKRSLLRSRLAHHCDQIPTPSDLSVEEANIDPSSPWGDPEERRRYHPFSLDSAAYQRWCARRWRPLGSRSWRGDGWLADSVQVSTLDMPLDKLFPPWRELVESRIRELEAVRG